MGWFGSEKPRVGCWEGGALGTGGCTGSWTGCATESGHLDEPIW